MRVPEAEPLNPLFICPSYSVLNPDPKAYTLNPKPY